MINNLHVRSSGRPDGAPVLLIHGWMVSSHVWDKLAPLLADYHLVMPDLRGCGRSPAFGEAVSLDRYVRDLLELCERLSLADYHLLGHSMGGQLALLLAAECPQRFRTLTLMNPVPVQGLPLPAELQDLFRHCGGRLDQLGAILDMACPQLESDERARLLDDAERIAPAVVSAGFDAWMQGKADVAHEVIAMPTTVIASDDPFLPAAFLETAVVQDLPRAKLRYLAGAGHYPQCEMPAATAELLKGIWR